MQIQNKTKIIHDIWNFSFRFNCDHQFRYKHDIGVSVIADVQLILLLFVHLFVNGTNALLNRQEIE